MTSSQIVKRIARETGYPEHVVAHVMDKQIEIIRGSLLLREVVLFRGLLKITPYDRKVSIQLPGKPRELSDKLCLSVKPLRIFRKEMNAWKSTA